MIWIKIVDCYLYDVEVERKLDEALREGDFDLLQERITPKTLTSCKTNALFKTFEVSWAFLRTYTINCYPLSSPINLNFKISPEWRSSCHQFGWRHRFAVVPFAQYAAAHPGCFLSLRPSQIEIQSVSLAPLNRENSHKSVEEFV